MLFHSDILFSLPSFALNLCGQHLKVSCSFETAAHYISCWLRTLTFSQSLCFPRAQFEPPGEFVIALRSDAGNLAGRFVEILSLMIAQKYEDIQRQKVFLTKKVHQVFMQEKRSIQITSGKLQFNWESVWVNSICAFWQILWILCGLFGSVNISDSSSP